METKETNKPEITPADAATETLLDRALKADAYLKDRDPSAPNIDPMLFLDLMGGDKFVEAAEMGHENGASIRLMEPDRFIVSMPHANLRDKIDGIIIRTAGKPNLVHVFFVEGARSANDKALELFAKFGSNKLGAMLALAAEIKESGGKGIAPAVQDVPAHRNLQGFRIASAAYGVTAWELLDVVRAHTGMVIEPDPEWEASRKEYVAHTRTCDCENCQRTQKNQAALHEKFYGVSGVLVTEASSATAKAPTVAFTSAELEAAKARSTVHEAPATVN